MAELSAVPEYLVGFGEDLIDLARHFAPRATREIEYLTLPTDSSELLAIVEPRLRSFQEDAERAYTACHSQLASFGPELADAGRRYADQDQQTAASLATEPRSAVDQGVGRLVRYPGLSLPVLADVEVEVSTIRATVETAVDLLAPFDRELGEVAGVRPVADFLVPVMVGWEVFQTLGRRMRVLGAIDYATSGGIDGGCRWLAEYWSGSAADHFRGALQRLSQAMIDRGTRLHTIASRFEQVGECLVRLVYNQVVGLTTDLLQEMEFWNFKLPLASWGRIIDQPMRDSVRTDITAAISRMVQDANERKSRIVDLLDIVVENLQLHSGEMASIPGDGLIPPTKLVFDYRTRRYGFGDNLSWEQSYAPAH
ncbi:hypothetical protein ACWDYH_36380 [Nocardia goodfellowii]